jgi:hypothetical protein
MVERKTIDVNDEFSISVVTERMNDGDWAVVSSVKHRSATGEKTIDMPVRSTRFSSQAEAEEAGVSQAREWLERNAPRAA